MRLGRNLALGAVLGCAVALSQASASSQEPASSFSAIAVVTTLEVPVIVLEGGVPVRGLTQDDFEILQDGVAQKILGFESVELYRTEQHVDASPGTLSGRRYFLLAFDLSHTRAVNALRAVSAARELLSEGLDRSDLVGVAVYSARAGARLLHPFTADPLELESALTAVQAVASRDPEALAAVTVEQSDGEGSARIDRFLREIQSFIGGQGVGLESTVGPAGEWLEVADASGLGGALLAEILQEMEAEHQKAMTNIVRDRSFDLLETLAELTAALENVRGQKHFVLFSEGIDESIFEDFSDTRGSSRLSRLLEVIRRSGWRVQSINVGQDKSFDRGLGLLARETGGREYRNFGSLDQAMDRLLEQTAVSYVLSFQPEGLEADGSYHHLEVRLPGHKGVAISYRDGYFAPTEAALDATRLVAESDRVLAHKDGGPLGLSVLAPVFRRSDSTAFVSAIIEIDGTDLLADSGETRIDLEISSYLLVRGSGAVALSARRLSIEPAVHGDLIRGGGVRILDQLLVGSGSARLRFVVQERSRATRSSVTVSIEVPSPAPKTPRLLSPLFPGISPGWLVVRETAATGGVAAEDSPFEFGGREFIPRAHVVLAPGVKVPVCLMAFDVVEDSPQFSLELLTESGESTDAGLVQIASGPERTPMGLTRVMAELDTTGMARGTYRLHFRKSAEQASGSLEATSEIEIR